jgi:hypothetical protein
MLPQRATASYDGAAPGQRRRSVPVDTERTSLRRSGRQEGTPLRRSGRQGR